MKALLATFLLISSATLAQARTFGAVEGTYKILSCDNISRKGQEKLCEFDTLVVSPKNHSTAIYFKHSTKAELGIRSFGFPANTKGLPGAEYKETPTPSAAYANFTEELEEYTRIEKLKDGTFAVSVYRDSNIFDKHDAYEMIVERTSVIGPELPSAPDEPQNPWGPDDNY